MQYDNPNIKFVAPSEGLSLWSDNMLVPNKADHKANAEKLMNYYYDPEVAAQLAAWVNYICPVEGAEEAMAKIDDGAGRQPADLPGRRASGATFGFMPHRHARRASSTTRTSTQSSERDPVTRAAAAEDLVLTGVTKHFGSFIAVDDLDLTVPQGSFFALLGASGCGKTTTLRMVAGLEEPTPARSARRRGHHRLKPYKRPVNTVFQSYALFPHLTIFENVAFGLRRTGVKDVSQQVAEMLELVQLDGFRRAASPRSSPAGSSSGSRWPAR